MIIHGIWYSTRFQKELKNLPKQIRERAIKKETLFKKNPYHPSLRLHQLRGKCIGAWSMSITKNYRIIFLPKEHGIILFVSIGTHDIYRSL